MYLFLVQHSDCHTESVDGVETTPISKGKTRGIAYLIAANSAIIDCAFTQSSGLLIL